MLFNRKEKAIIDLMGQHINKVGDALEHLQKTIDLYLDSQKEFKEEAGLVHTRENEADEIKDNVLTKLYEGAFMPPNREDYVVLAELIDGIANRAQRTSNLFVLTRPEIPEFLKGLLKELTRGALQTFTALKEVFYSFNHDINKVKMKAEAVEELEGKVDCLEWESIKEISKLLKDLAHKLQLREIIQDVASIADLAEDAADRFKLMLIKQTF